MQDDEARQELEATLAARRELGPGHDDELIGGFLDRIDREIERRVQEKLAEQRNRTPLAAVLGPMIPITIFAGIFGGPAGVFAALILAGVIVVLTELRR